MKPDDFNRRYHVGAELIPNRGVHFRIWAPKRRTVEIVLESNQGRSPALELQREPNGYFSGLIPDLGHGMQYRVRLDGESDLYPDPASRFQPEGPHGPSQIIDPTRFVWSDLRWPGVTLEGSVIYEMHLGTFTPEGTWQSAMNELPELAELGINVIEVMPVAEFPGKFGWGYDGVDLYAPTRLYGEPDDFRRFVDRAHNLGIGVILDVVYNHFGPDGNYWKQFSDFYLTDRYCTDWGEALNFDNEQSQPVRDFILDNASYWIEEFHLDGLRIDATQNIYDESDENIMAAITSRVRRAAQGRGTIIIGENEPQDVKLVRPVEKGGYGMDALWNDDFHHSAMVAMTGRNEAYYTDYLGRPQEFISAIKYGYLYQGQWYKWQKKRRGTSGLSLPPATFVTFIQNHDQIANSGRGERCHQLTSPGQFRAMTALMLLAPGTPMLFQGQEFAASSPFFYFADHHEELARLVCQGRAEFLSQFRSLSTEEIQSCLPDPADPQTFERSKLDFRDREKNAGVYRMHRDLLTLRRADPIFRAQRRGGVDGAVLSTEAFVLRFFADDPEDDRLMIVNFGIDLHLNPAPEPLLAPPAGKRWENLWSSEAAEYGGLGTARLDTNKNWQIPGHSAVVLKPIEAQIIEKIEADEAEKERKKEDAEKEKERNKR